MWFSSSFLKAVFHKFYFIHSWIPWPIHYNKEYDDLNVIFLQDHPFIMYGNSSKKLKFMTAWYPKVGVDASGFVYVLNRWSLV